ncbi:universal stress protein [Muricauda sp. CAU 1633]|uniref:universal stress protein n=1 Tax=Allomuricauda sp. CAU 1633 TaxID=2816036 RepID=UPI001A8E9145|nr:universal stress protein [Muricauda sp. CAU 1633]MBO0323208.1 universal stress protein [Muricauda sp. CAU 1633]
MNPKNTSSKYRISVLLDLSKSSELVLTNAVQLAKTLNGSVEVFHVKPAADIVKRESQLSAIRTIYKDNRDTRSKMQDLIQSMEKEEGISLSYKLEYGNVKNRVRDYLSQQKPDILVLGKRRPGFFGESITDFVINETNINVLITGKDDKFHTFTDINLGVFGSGLRENGLDIIKDLKRDSEKPVRLFNIKGKITQGEHEVSPWHKTVSYVFSEGSNALDGLVSYVSHTNTQLLCVPKSQSKTLAFQSNPAKQVMRKANVPIFIMA